MSLKAVADMGICLTSMGMPPIEALELAVGQELDDLEAVVIANGKDTLPNRATSLKKRIAALGEYGMKAAELDLRETSEKELTRRLEGADLLHIMGGTGVFAFMELAQESGLAKFLGNYKNSPAIWGESLGAIVLGPTIEPFEYSVNAKGFGLIDQVPVPHYGSKSKEYLPYLEIFADDTDNYAGHKLILLRDKLNIRPYPGGDVYISTSGFDGYFTPPQTVGV